jgi:glutamate carboxypeptidase
MLQPEENKHPHLEDPSNVFATPASVPVATATFVRNSVAYVEQNMERFLKDLETLCLIESPSDDKAGLDAMAQQLAKLLQRIGMQIELVEHPRGNAVIGTLVGDNPSAPDCLLLGHHDTVHPVGVARSRVRFTEDRFYGPGTVDMKAGLLQGIYALEALIQQRYRDFHIIRFLSVSDEELSSRYHVGLIKQLAREQLCVLGLEGARSPGNVVTRRKGCRHYRLTARGVAAHAGSRPENGRNAVLELAHQIVQAHNLMGWREGMTINAGPITGGSRANIVSDFAEIIFDLRFLRMEDRLAAEERWQEFLRHQLVPGVTLTLSPEPDSMQPMEATEKSLAMAYQVQRIAEQILGVPFDPETRGGASDCCNTAAAGCPSIDGLGAIGGGAHTAEEYVLLAPIPKRVALLAGLLTTMQSALFSNPSLAE